MGTPKQQRALILSALFARALYLSPAATRCRTTCPHLDSNQGPPPYRRQIGENKNGLVSERCAPTWIRTRDRLLKRELLYQLSYRGTPLTKRQSIFIFNDRTDGSILIEQRDLPLLC